MKREEDLLLYMKCWREMQTFLSEVVREICRRSENTYYDWCCDVCCMRGENCRANGWCRSFWPGKVRKNA
jgi:hypothetical protein